MPALTNDVRKLRGDLKKEEYFQAGEVAGHMLGIVTVPIAEKDAEINISEIDLSDLDLSDFGFEWNWKREILSNLY